MSLAPTSTFPSTTATLEQINARSRASSTAGNALASAAEQSDRFLTLLVTQMKNQDPLNPMDNAQITTQMAQISTVSGIDKLAGAVADMNTMMLQSQTLQGATLVGKNVLVAGHRLTLDESGVAGAGLELDQAARSVTVTIKDAGGKIVDTLDLGGLAAGRHVFDWSAADIKAKGLTFEVSARNGTATVGVTRLVADRVDAVYADQGQLSIATLNNGTVRYSDVKGVS